MNEEIEPYIAPELSDLGEVTVVTLGTLGVNDPDDTQYWEGH
ncbi:hypothetical protein ACIP6P_32745 [Streptomyces sp. NPDC088729]